jgi:hypothetical protein
LVGNTFLTTPSMRVRRKSDRFFAVRARSADRIELAYLEGPVGDDTVIGEGTLEERRRITTDSQNESVIAAASVFAGNTAVMLVHERGMRRTAVAGQRGLPCGRTSATPPPTAP